MEWWQPIVSFASIIVVGIAAWSLKVLVGIHAELAGLREWRRQVDARLDKGEQRMDRHSSHLRNRGYHSQHTLPPAREQ